VPRKCCAEIDPRDAVEVLAAYIRGIRTPEKITAHLRYRGFNVSISRVAAIFARYDLEQNPKDKKNPFRVAGLLINAAGGVPSFSMFGIKQAFSETRFHMRQCDEIRTMLT